MIKNGSYKFFRMLLKFTFFKIMFKKPHINYISFEISHFRNFLNLFAILLLISFFSACYDCPIENGHYKAKNQKEKDTTKSHDLTSWYPDLKSLHKKDGRKKN